MENYNKLDNINEMNKFLSRNKLPKITQNRKCG